MTVKITASQLQALRWLAQRYGDGLFDKNGVLVAGGEVAPFLRLTWNALRDAGLVEMYSPTGKGRGRCKLTPAGQQKAAVTS